MAPDFTHESAARAQGFHRIAGVDEVGRGPLAGPVLACAVVLDPARIPPGLNDSKLLGAARRGDLATAICAAAEVSIGMASVAEIDALNILRAACSKSAYENFVRCSGRSIRHLACRQPPCLLLH